MDLGHEHFKNLKIIFLLFLPAYFYINTEPFREHFKISLFNSSNSKFESKMLFNTVLLGPDP